MKGLERLRSQLTEIEGLLSGGKIATRDANGCMAYLSGRGAIRFYVDLARCHGHPSESLKLQVDLWGRAEVDEEYGGIVRACKEYALKIQGRKA